MSSARLPIPLLLLVLFLTGCGFQLRGSDLTALEELQVTGMASAPATFRGLKEQLDRRGIATASNSAGALRVQLLDERTIRRSVATTARIDTAEYELRLEVDLAVSRGDRELFNETMVTQRIYAVDSVNLSASTEEQRLLMQEMRREMTDNIIRRIDILTRKP